MEIIKTTAPIALDELKKYFANKDTAFLIDYGNSQLRGAKLLTYVSNLDLPIDIDNVDFELLKEYFHSISLLNAPSLEIAAIKVLFEYKGLTDDGTYRDFIKDNAEIIEIWARKLDSLTLYNLYTVASEELKDYAQSHPNNNTDSLVGINFVSLLKHEVFYLWYGSINSDTLEFYSRYFNDYMFKGKHLYSFWANENNPMFLLTYGIAAGIVDPAEYVKAKERTYEELKDVSPV